MKPRYAISIPKPCHENWSEMTPNEKGRFCQSCSKTVVDFTKMNTNEVQTFIHHNKDQRICGHIKQNQLDAINLQVSETVFEQHLSFQKLFLLALLLAMGTSLFSCSDDNGRIKKIESVEIIEPKIDSAQILAKRLSDTTTTSCFRKMEKADSIVKKNPVPPPIPIINGLVITGEVIDNTRDPIPVDSIIEPDYPEIEGEMRIHDDVTIGLLSIDVPPQFPNTPNNLSQKEQQDYFNSKMNAFVQKHFNIETAVNLGLTGRQRIYIQFEIDKDGQIQDIKTRSPHPLFDKEAIRVIKLLPKFNPGKQRGQFTPVIYNLPIVFNMED
ncbi:energy transducer TonB [uncultured Psychroserpens sp.]|uniref:energy transducer TonB n=1 Tax=uncultured Psychroserpens sp. TaxID=255436 RepID=UPI002626915B|nr:energy transducer TonB [uncultured Psychroserpens sp.]